MEITLKLTPEAAQAVKQVKVKGAITDATPTK
jgi:hypothetical protein